uniref:Uncharacterized protein LOC105043947 n=1 Tax=Elaeis guineensis var. tenera TaxID=51953 RepID=A0A6I9R5G6_ELAGV|nr:uncharacterized protein LOC105043947 [Elaeis guineensis]
METPSSTRRITRSQASAASQKKKEEDALSRSRNGERPALLDITNDSPIVGLATGSLVEKTPSSSAVKNRVRAKRTPGSGEALLRGQVKTLLQKVEEEAVLVNKLPSGHSTFLLGLPNSPALLLAPTPANTPYIPNMSALEEGALIDAKMPCVTEDITNPQQAAASLKQDKSLHAQECLINRALLFDDSPGKSEMSSDASTISSSLTYQGSESGYVEKSPEDDNSSIWSLQVNASIQEDDEDVAEDVEEFYHEEAEDEVDEEEDELLNDLCAGLSKMSVQDKVGLPEFTGKRTRFIYNSDDEIVGEEVVAHEKKAVSPNALVLKGLPAPEGKHLRFPEEEEDEV